MVDAGLRGLLQDRRRTRRRHSKLSLVLRIHLRVRQRTQEGRDHDVRRLHRQRRHLCDDKSGRHGTRLPVLRHRHGRHRVHTQQGRHHEPAVMAEQRARQGVLEYNRPVRRPRPRERLSRSVPRGHGMEEIVARHHRPLHRGGVLHRVRRLGQGRVGGRRRRHPRVAVRNRHPDCRRVRLVHRHAGYRPRPVRVVSLGNSPTGTTTFTTGTTTGTREFRNEVFYSFSSRCWYSGMFFQLVRTPVEMKLPSSRNIV